MNYIEVTCTVEGDQDLSKDILVSLLGDLGFDSFNEDEEGRLRAYITENLFSAQAVEAVLDDFPIDATCHFTHQVIVSKNWNEEWEKHFFKPIVIDNTCAIYSSFHTDIPAVTYGITIDPKMSFGTGHHETTGMMIRWLLQEELSGKAVLDMGCGTAVLAILAAMKGAKPIVAIDNDDWAYNNALENVALNNVEGIKVALGDANLLGEEYFDCILANINRNILLNDIPRYAAVLLEGGSLFMSGFYEEDVPLIEKRCQEVGLQLKGQTCDKHWASLQFEKPTTG